MGLGVVVGSQSWSYVANYSLFYLLGHAYFTPLERI